MAQERALPREMWSGNPEDFSQGGRDNIDVEIVKSRFAPDHYPNKTKHFCFFRVTYRTLEDTAEEFTERYRVGFLNQVLPTNSDADTPKEEREPAGGDDSIYQQLSEGAVQLEDNEIEEYEGTYLMGRPQKGDDFLVWLGALVECGFQPNGPDATQFEGLQLHLDRGKGSSYKDKESGEEKFSTILLPSAIIGGGKKAAGKPASKASATTNTTKTGAATVTKTAASTSTTKAAKSNGSAALDSIAETIRELIDTHGEDGAMSKAATILKLAKTKEFQGLKDADRAAVMEAWNNDRLFVTSRGLVYDPEDDMISKL